MPPPALPHCHLCGRQFGTSSLQIHLKACKEKWERDHPGKTAPEPAAPIPINAKAGGKEWAAFNATAQETFESETMEACPHCNRTFLPDRLPIHLRTCGKGNFANPVPRPRPGGEPTGTSPERSAAQNTSTQMGNLGAQARQRPTTPAKQAPAGPDSSPQKSNTTSTANPPGSAKRPDSARRPDSVPAPWRATRTAK